MSRWDEGGAERSLAPRRIYAGLALLLLMWPATGGMWLLGSTRTWGFAPGLAISFLGSLLVLARPLVFRDPLRGYAPAGFWIFAALAAYVAVRVPAAAVPYAARWEALRWVCLAAAAWSWTQMAARARRWQVLLFVLLLSVAFQGLYAMVQEMNGSRQVLWALRPEQYGLRASGTFLCPNHFANVLAMLLPVAAVLLFLPEAGLPLRLMALYFLAAALPPLYWSLSRSAWIGTLAGLGATALLLALRRSRAWFLAALVGLPLLAAAAGWTAWKTLPGVQARVGQVLESKGASGGIRLPMWKDAPAMIRDRPLAGFGGGSFVWTYPAYQRRPQYHLTYDFLHNEFLQMQVEYGAIGTGLLLVGLLWGGAGAVLAIARTRSRAGAALLAAAAGAVAASLAQALFDFNFHVFPNPHVLVWVVGVAWGVWALGEPAGPPAPGWRRWLGRAGVAGAAAVCAAGAWLALAGGLGYFWNLKGELARERLDWDEAVAGYEKSIRWDRGNWQPHLGLGKVRSAQATRQRDPDQEAERAGKERLAAAAEASLVRARELNSCDMAVALMLGRVYNVRGEPAAALEEFRRAAAFKPRHVFYREQVGIQLRRMGRDREALETFRQNLEDRAGGETSALNVRLLERKLAREAAPAAP